MKQKQYRIPMDSEYRKKHYSNGYFEYLVNYNNSTGSKVGIWVAFIMLGILFNIGFIFGLIVFFVNDGIIPAFWVCMGIGVVQLLLASLIFRMGKKKSNKTSEDWIAEAAKDSQLPESTIRDFDRQIKTCDEIYHLTLRGSKEDYILTDDYILVANTMIISISELLGAGFTYEEEYYGTAKGLRSTKSLAVGLISKTRYWKIFTNKQLGFDFMNMLKEKNPNMIIRNEETMKIKEFDTWVNMLQ